MKTLQLVSLQAKWFSLSRLRSSCLGDPFRTTFSEPEVFNFPAGIGPVECVNVEHEEVALVPRYLDTKRVTFKYGLGDEFIGVLKTLNLMGLDSTDPISVRTAPNVEGKRSVASVSPRDLVAAVLSDPATLGERMSGTTCAGTWVTGKGPDGSPREVYLYHAIDNAWTMEHYDAQCVVWQTALAPALALLLCRGPPVLQLRLTAAAGRACGVRPRG